jgi:hypothetical protein
MILALRLGFNAYRLWAALIFGFVKLLPTGTQTPGNLFLIK